MACYLSAVALHLKLFELYISLYCHSERSVGCLLMQPVRLLMVTEVVTMSISLSY